VGGDQEDGAQGSKTRDDAHHPQRRAVSQRANEPPSDPTEDGLRGALQGCRTTHPLAHGAKRERGDVRQDTAQCGAKRKKEYRECERARVPACDDGQQQQRQQYRGKAGGRSSKD